jgi:hypothetical protein
MHDAHYHQESVYDHEHCSRYELNSGEHLYYEVHYSTPTHGKHGGKHGGKHDAGGYSVKGIIDVFVKKTDTNNFSIVLNCSLNSVVVGEISKEVDKRKSVVISAELNKSGGLSFVDKEPDYTLAHSDIPAAYARVLRGVIVMFPILPPKWKGCVVKGQEDSWSYNYGVTEPFTITAVDRTGTGKSGLITEVSSVFSNGMVEYGVMKTFRIINGATLLASEMRVKLVRTK